MSHQLIQVNTDIAELQSKSTPEVQTILERYTTREIGYANRYDMISEIMTHRYGENWRDFIPDVKLASEY